MTTRRAYALALPVIVLALVAIVPARAVAQQPLPPPQPPVYATKLEALLATPDVVLVQDSYRIDTPPSFGMALDAVVVTEVDPEHRRLDGLRISLRDANKPAGQTSSLLDRDEAVDSSRALASMADLAARWTGGGAQRSTDIHFATAGGFTVGIRQTGRVQNGFVSSGLADADRTPIDVADFATLKVAVDQAIAALAGK